MARDKNQHDIKRKQRRGEGGKREGGRERTATQATLNQVNLIRNYLKRFDLLGIDESAFTVDEALDGDERPFPSGADASGATSAMRILGGRDRFDASDSGRLQHHLTAIH